MAADVPDANWTSALCLTVYIARSVRDKAFDRGLARVLSTVGADGPFGGGAEARCGTAG